MAYQGPYDLKAFVLANYQSLTVSDMAEETGVTVNQISLVCKELRLKPVTGREILLNYLRQYASKKTFEQLEKATGLSPKTLKVYMSKAGVRALDAKAVGRPTQKLAVVPHSLDIPTLAAQLGTVRTGGVFTGKNQARQHLQHLARRADKIDKQDLRKRPRIN